MGNQYKKIDIVAPNGKARIPGARAFQFSGSVFTATIKSEEVNYGPSGAATSSVINSVSFDGDATPSNIIPVAASQFTSSNGTTTIIVYS